MRRMFLHLDMPEAVGTLDIEEQSDGTWNVERRTFANNHRRHAVITPGTHEPDMDPWTTVHEALRLTDVAHGMG